jgi:Uma2 family endonuclease
VPSPISDLHADFTGRVGGWLSYYAFRTPGVRRSGTVTLILDGLGQPEPDATLRILPESGGRTRSVRHYIHGAPESIVEVAVTSRAQDLGPQLDDYERAGAPEYIVFAHQPDEIYWHVLQEGRLRRIEPDPDGVYRSRAFPGLWLDPAAFWANDDPALLRALEAGLNSPEHTAFIARLRERRGGG